MGEHNCSGLPELCKSQGRMTNKPLGRRVEGEVTTLDWITGLDYGGGILLKTNSLTLHLTTVKPL